MNKYLELLVVEFMGKYGNNDVTPVSCERKAIDDIRSSEKYKGASIKYHPYDR